MNLMVERAMTVGERKRLMDCMPPAPTPFHTRRFKLQLMGEIIGVLLAVIILIWLKSIPATFAIPAACIGYAIWWRLHLKIRVLTPLRESRTVNQRVDTFRKAVESAKSVRVHSVESDAVVQLTHDEGTVCVYGVGDNQSYWIDPTL